MTQLELSREARFGRQWFLNPKEQTSVCTGVLCYDSYLQPEADSFHPAAVYIQETHAPRHVIRYHWALW